MFHVSHMLFYVNDLAKLVSEITDFFGGYLFDEGNFVWQNLEDLKESAMVRHECAEALGSIAKDQCLTALEKYSEDQERVVKESCVVALDMYSYEQSKDFQYADSLVKMKET